MHTNTLPLFTSRSVVSTSLRCILTSLFKNYIEQLRTVEYHYGIRFEDFPYSEVTFESEKVLRTIIHVIKQESIESEHNEDLKITYKEINSDVIKQLEEIKDIPNAVVAQNTIVDEVTLHGFHIMFYKVLKVLARSYRQ